MHCPSLVQLEQLLLAQIWPAGQLLLSWQLPVMQTPLLQI